MVDISQDLNEQPRRHASRVAMEIAVIVILLTLLASLAIH